MSPIPGEPLDSSRLEMKTKDGRRVKLKVPGLQPPIKPSKTEERGSEEPPREDPRPPTNPYNVGL